MCRPHWTAYTRALRAAATGRKEAGGAEPTVPSQAAARVATKRAARVGGTTALLRKQVRALAKPPKQPEPIRVKVPRVARTTAGEPIVEAVDATIVEEASIG